MLLLLFGAAAVVVNAWARVEERWMCCCCCCCCFRWRWSPEPVCRCCPKKLEKEEEFEVMLRLLLALTQLLPETRHR